MADIFISYASEDRNRVRPLADALQARGFNVWWDRSLAAGHDYSSVIERELRAAKAVIVVWTQNSAVSTFVRDEAGRARDDGRLVPVLFDRVDIPLGFGAFQAEDFTRWNGAANAPQVQILEEAVRAKLEGRDVDGGAVARKRRRMMARIRIVSVLTVIALIVGIAVGGKYLFAPPPEPDLRAELLRLLAEGQLTPEQAIQLAQILESGALGGGPSSAPSASADDGMAPSASTRSADVEVATIAEAAFEADASQAYHTAFLALARHPDAQVRLAVARMADDASRASAMQTLWQYARDNPDDPLRDEIYLLCGSVGESNALPLGQRALEQAANVAPRNPSVWRMLSRSYDRTDADTAAQAALTVAEGVEAQNAGDAVVAEQRLREGLNLLRSPELRAPVASQLGQIAEDRGDHLAASARFAQAYSAREQVAAQAPNSAAAQAIDAEAQQLVRSLDRSGRTAQACEQLRQAQEAHDVAAPDEDLLRRCQRQFRVPLRDQVDLAPQLRQRPSVTRTPQPVEPAP